MKAFFCCKEIEVFLNDPRDPIEYDPVFREYFIRLSNCSNIITFSYCPWCGSELLSSLRESYFDVLEKEYHVETNIGEYKKRSDIPSEFKTDRWWKSREARLSSFASFIQIEQLKQSSKKEIDREMNIIRSEWLYEKR